MSNSLIYSYKKLNESFKKKLSYRIGDDGFFSNYNCMIYAMLYCLNNKIQFNLCNSGNYFGKQDNDPNIFFEPFTNQVIDNGKHFRTTNYKYALKKLLKGNLNTIKSLYPYINFWKKQLYTQDVWGKSTDLSAQKKRYVIPELQIDSDMRTACSRLVELTWRYTEHTKAEVENCMNTVNLPSNYIGFHIRRGDKDTEVSLENINEYIEKAETLSSVRNAYILTDDYTVIEEIKQKYPQWHVYALCKPGERGYTHSIFMQTDPVKKRNSVITLFANIEILAKSDYFIGNFYSNVGSYLGMRMDKSKVYSIDNFRWGF